VAKSGATPGASVSVADWWDKDRRADCGCRSLVVAVEPPPEPWMSAIERENYRKFYSTLYDPDIVTAAVEELGKAFRKGLSDWGKAVAAAMAEEAPPKDICATRHCGHSIREHGKICLVAACPCTGFTRG
jgi:hypothetical protein